jgi:hypothetical protein
MSTPSPQLDQSDRELLVAYLDGELSPEDGAVVESRLAGDDSFRRELQELQRAWDALNQLPRPTADEDFTRTTLEMVAIAAQEDVQAATTALPSRRRRYAARVLGLVVAAVVAGALLARLIWPDRNDELIANLPIIENIDAYRHLGGMEFLQRLHEEHGDALEKISPLRQEDVAQAWAEWQSVSHADESRRRERIAALDPAAAGRLQAKWKQFETLPGTTETQLRTLHENLIDNEQSRELYATVVRFGELLSRRSSGDKVDLRAKAEVEQRLEVVGSWLRRERPRRHRELTYEDREKLRTFQRAAFDRRRERRSEGSLTEEERQKQREASQQELDTLIESLSPEAREDLKEDDGDWDYEELIGWLWDATPSRHQLPQELEELFVSIEDNDEKARLLLMPYFEMHRELRDRYLRPFDDGRWRNRDRRGPGGFDGRRRGDGPDRRRGDRDGRGDGGDDDRDDDRPRRGFRDD